MAITNNTVLIEPVKMAERLSSILLKYGFEEKKAGKCAEIFTNSSVDGIYTHGINRFIRFVDHIKKGYIRPDAEPALKRKAGNIEQWDGNLGPGPLNAFVATDRAMELAMEGGMGCVALSNTNHWMRGGSYGWQAARRGFAFIGFTNTIANMPAWGAKDQKLGNNPLVVAIPYKDEAIVLDMAMSQYSFGAMEMAVIKKESLAYQGGFDKTGNLTNNPSAIIASRRPLPIGYWKGAGLSLLLDILAALLSGGLSTKEISKKEVEHAVSQVFIAIDLIQLGESSIINRTIQGIIDDYLESVPQDERTRISYPGQRVIETRIRNMENGIPVLNEVWEQVLSL